MPNGFETSLLVLAGNQDEVGIATALQQMWRPIGVKLDLQQVDNATRTDQYRAGTFPCALAAWTDDIADPNEITSYFAYSPTIDALHSGWKSDEVDALYVASQKEIDPAKRAERVRQDPGRSSTRPGRRSRSTRRPIRSRLAKNVNGFLQIPLGNNIFRATWLDEVVYLASCVRGPCGPGRLRTTGMPPGRECRSVAERSLAAAVLHLPARAAADPDLVFILIVVFALVRLLPGDPASAMLGDRALDADVARINAELGLDQPLPVQFVYLRRQASDRRSRQLDHSQDAGAST